MKISNLKKTIKYRLPVSYTHLEEKKGNIEITFSSDYSKNVKGDQLFEIVNRLFTRPRFKQIDNKIAIILPKGDQWLNRLNELISTLS